MSRKIMVFCVTVILLLSGLSTVVAAEFDPDQTGSISVTLMEQNQSQPIVGARLNVYRVASAAMDAAGQWIYDYTADFASCGTALDDPSLAVKLDAFVAQNNVPSVTITTDAQGSARCDDLAVGLYFVRQSGAVSGFAPCTPFLVTVPYQQDGAYVYEVNATPKTDVMRLASVTIKKVWNTDASTAAADSVTVQLLKDGNVIETATLSAANNWQITYTDMPESDAYSVKEVNVPKGFTATYQQQGYEFTVTNTSTLIQTGQLVWPIPLLAVGGLLLMAVGIALLQKKRKTDA